LATALLTTRFARPGPLVVGVKHVKAAHATDTVSIVKDGANATTGVAVWDFVDAALAVDGIVDDVFYEGA